MKRWFSLPIVLLLLSTPALADNPDHDLPGQAEEPMEEPTQDSILPNVADVPDLADLSPGDHVPDFKLRSSTGGLVRLSDLKGHLSLMLFGPDCALLRPFAADGDSLETLGVRPYGICMNSTREVEKYAARERLGFPMLSDPNANFSQRLGMYDADNQAIRTGLILLDAKGVILMMAQGAGLRPDAVPALVRQAMAAHHLAVPAGS